VADEAEPGATDEHAPVSTEHLRERVVHGLRWSFINQVANRGLTFAMGVVVLRVLSVDDVGQFAIAAAVAGVLMAFNELGLIPAIVQWQGDHRKAVATAHTIAIVNSVVLCGIVMVLAPWIADLAGTHEATGVIRVMSLTIVIDGFTSMPNALLARTFDQRGLAIAESTGLAAQIVLVVGMALLGWGAYSLAIGMVFSNVLVALVLLRFLPHIPIPGWRRDVVGPLLRFGTPIAGSSVLRDTAINADKFGVGALLGTQQLGYYNTAFNFSNLPANSLGQMVARVAFAGFSRLTHDTEQLDRAFRQAWLWLLVALMPMVALISALAEPIIRFIYGAKWLPAAPVLSILVVASGLRVMFMLTVDLITATGRPRTEFALYVFWSVVLIPAFIAGALLDGIRGVAIAQLLVVGVLLMPLVLMAVRPTGVHVRSIILSSLRPVLAGAAAGLVAWPIGTALAPHPFVACLVGGVVGLGVYALILLPFNHHLDLHVVRQMLRRNKATTTEIIPPPVTPTVP